MHNKLANLALAVLIAGFTTACVTTAQLNEVRDIARQAQADAAQAVNSVEAATQAASSAKSAADRAATKADQALQAAEAAKACCQANSDKIDRMFSKSMEK